MNKNEIIAEIEKNRGNNTYDFKIIGITNDPERRKKEHDVGENIAHWKDWKADSEQEARDIEQFFINKGMQGGTGGGDNPTYVYIF